MGQISKQNVTENLTKFGCRSDEIYDENFGVIEFLNVINSINVEEEQMLVYVNLIKECKEKDKVIENLKSENDNLKSENDALQHQLYFPATQ